MPDQLWRGSSRPGHAPGAAIGLTLLSTELASLANGSVSSISPAVDQFSPNFFGDMWLDAFLEVTFTSAPIAPFTCDLYIVRQVVDGVFEDGQGGASGTYILPENGYVGTFKFRGVTTIQRKAIWGIEAPVREHKFLLLNQSGVAFPASGSTVKGFYYRTQSL